MPEYKPGDPFGLIGPGGRIVLDAAAARVLNEIRDRIRWLKGLVGVPPVSVDHAEDGRRILIDLPTSFPAKLSGAGNPYSYAEQVAATGGTWTNLAGGRTGSDAYEANAVTGLTGKVVNLRSSEANDWRFQYIKKGSAASWTGKIVGCNGLSTGVGVHAVTVKNSTTNAVIWTGSSDANGIYTGSGTIGTQVRVEVTPSNAAFASFAGNVAVSGTTTKTIGDVTLSPATGYHCGCSSCVMPWPDTLHATTAAGAMTLTYSNSFPGPLGVTLRGWKGCLDLNLGTGTTNIFTGNCDPASGNSPFPLAIVLGTGNACNYAWGAYACCIDFNTCGYLVGGGSGNPPVCPANINSPNTNAGLTVQCSPLVITINWQFDHTHCPQCTQTDPIGPAWPYYPTTTITP